MAAYAYQALDPQGREICGVLEADSSRAARAQLREQQLYPLGIQPVGASARSHPDARRLLPQRLPYSQLCLITRQWAMLLDASLTLEQSLNALIEQVDQTGTRQILAGLRTEILAGHSLHRALQQYPGIFPPIYRAIVAAGEQSGQLAPLLQRLADYLEAWQTTRQKALQALLYPLLVTLVAVLVILGLLTYVVPQIVDVFQQSKQALPGLTRALIWTSDQLRQHLWWLLPMAFCLPWLLRSAIRRDPALHDRWHRWLLGLPLIGRHLRTMDSARLASTLTIMVGSGVPLLTALETAQAVLGNRILIRGLEAAIRRLREGASLARALGEEKLFPPLLIHMIASGEASGQLERMLERAARQQQNELEQRTALALSLFEPLLILVMGGLVLIIVLAVLLPIIEINTLMH